MSQAKFKAPKAVMDGLNELKQVDYDTLETLLADIYDSACDDWIVNQFIKQHKSGMEAELALIEYVIWNKPTIELERERHYVVVIEESKNIYAKGDEIPLDVFVGSTCISYNYEDGWPKEEAERLNKTINGKLVEVK